MATNPTALNEWLEARRSLRHFGNRRLALLALFILSEALVACGMWWSPEAGRYWSVCGAVLMVAFIAMDVHAVSRIRELASTAAALGPVKAQQPHRLLTMLMTAAPLVLYVTLGGLVVLSHADRERSEQVNAQQARAFHEATAALERIAKATESVSTQHAGLPPAPLPPPAATASAHSLLFWTTVVSGFLAFGFLIAFVVVTLRPGAASAGAQSRMGLGAVLSLVITLMSGGGSSLLGTLEAASSVLNNTMSAAGTLQQLLRAWGIGEEGPLGPRQNSRSATAYFATNRAEILNAEAFDAQLSELARVSTRMLDKAKDDIEKLDRCALTITAGADRVGDAQYNFKLAKDRSEAVKAKVIAAHTGLTPTLRIVGEMAPIVQTSDNVSEAINRRAVVDLVCIPFADLDR